MFSCTDASLCVIITDAGTSSSSTFEGLLDRVLNSAALASLYLVFTPESSRNMLQPAIPPHEWLREVGCGVGNAKRATLQSAPANHNAPWSRPKSDVQKQLLRLGGVRTDGTLDLAS